MAEQSLKDKTVKGVGWSAVDGILGYGIRFVVGIVLARLLSPEEYGLIGLVTIVMTVLDGFIDCGFSNSLIRKTELNKGDYETLFFFNMVMSVLLYALLFVGSPWIASFFVRPQLVALCRVLGILLILQAFSVVQYTILSRNIDFKTKTKASLISSVLSGIISISMALSGFGVWSLVALQLSKQFFFSLLLWIFNKWWPKYKLNFDCLRYMWSFGWKLTLSGLIDRVWNQLYQSVVGKCYSPATLGQYSRAKEYASLFSSNLTVVIQRVSYPVFSQVRDDTPRMVSAYRRVIKATMFVTAIIMIGMGAIAEPFIYCLIGPQWHEAATYLPLICASLSLFPLHAINLNMLQVQGRTDIYLYIEIIKKILGIGPLCLGIFVSIYWMLAGSLVVGIISFFLNSYYTGKKIGYTSWMQMKDVAPSYGVAFLIALAVFFLKYLPVSNWIILPMQLLVGTVVLISTCEITKTSEYMEIKGIAKTYIVKGINTIRGFK